MQLEKFNAIIIDIMKKKDYESPSTKHVLIELESSICASSISSPETLDSSMQQLDINKQLDGGTFDFEQDGYNTWN